MRFSTSFREPVRRRLEKMEAADIVIGIPCWNNDSTIAYVIKAIEDGLLKYYGDKKCVTVVSDGGSTDDTREEAEELERTPWIERIVAIYRGIPGKGSAVREIFEAANLLGAKACAIFDSDLRSITPEWVERVISPIMSDKYDFVAPYYKRYKYDGTITNNIVYNLTRALYGYRVRQPIGGDFGFSLPLIREYLKEETWETDVGRFGIDIWLTTLAMIKSFRIAQTNLGVKIHDVKDPAEALGPMFQQVVSTLFTLMEGNKDVWEHIKGSKEVLIVGQEVDNEPEAFTVNQTKLIDDFKLGFQRFSEIWRKIILPENFTIIESLFNKNGKDFVMPTESWVKILYDLAVTFKCWKTNRRSLMGIMTPLYFARIASFINRTLDMNNQEAEMVVEEQAQMFEEQKDYLIQRWNDHSMYDITAGIACEIK